MERRGLWAMKAPVDLLVIQLDEESKWVMALESSVSELTEMRQTCPFGTYNVLHKMIDAPCATQTLMSPMLIAEMDDPLTPLAEWGLVG